ncbi:nucleotidyltransferase family protein [Dyadobacter sp. LHD-138]|uniref:nucleotidyltransferase domain-containing protein n=1 Tax=Dyadobacter sp. LHD-138 TaxID=3071413 RepID=UPI0027DF2919|nr:nucleotidyltransferase family protein [Dyadobacter sp. LHD-138]MDQ6480824.1 nucleotidyltransferase family protein [Dyadobacter sp. LHD-138]
MSLNPLSPQLSFLVKSSLGGNADALILPVSVNVSDWEQLCELAEWHQVGALLFDAQQANPNREIPSSWFEKLRESSQNQAVFNMLFLRRSIEISKDLASDNIDAFLMKGALWAWMLYENPGLREFGDIDFFLRKEQITGGLKVLARNNFEPDVYRKYLLNENKVARLYFDTDYQLPLTPITTDIIYSIEVQWNTTYPRYHYSLTWTELTSQMMDFSVSGTTLRVPSSENQLLMMLIHHGGVEQWDKLKYMADLVRLLRKFSGQINWDYVIGVSKKKGFYRILLESLGLVRILSGENYFHFVGNHLEMNYPTPEFYNKVIGHWENTRIKPVTKSWRIFYFNMIYRDRLSDKLSILFSHLAYLLEWRLIIPKARWYRGKS